MDEKVAQRAGVFSTPLTTANVEKHLEDVGLDKVGKCFPPFSA